MVKFKGLGEVTVTTAGTPVPLIETEVITPGCAIMCLSTNVGKIYVGGADLSSTTRGVELDPGEVLEIQGPQIGGNQEEFDLSEIYIDSESNGDKVIVSYFTRG